MMQFERPNAVIPPEADALATGDVFYIVNPLVLETDGSRILGPFTREQLESKRRMYEAIARNMGAKDRANHPLIVLRLTDDEGYRKILGIPLK